MYEQTADRERLAPQEVEILVDLLDSRAWEILVNIQEKYINDPALRTLQESTDIHEIVRAQGMRRAFRDLDGILSRIYKGAKEETKAALAAEEENLDE